jgi:hypothetical protein
MRKKSTLFAIVVFFLICTWLLPIIANPLPYTGLDWLSLESVTVAQYGYGGDSDSGGDDDDDTPLPPPCDVDQSGRDNVYDPETFTEECDCSLDIRVDFPPGAVDVPVEMRAYHSPELPTGVPAPTGGIIGCPFFVGAWIKGEDKTVDKFNESIVINVDYGNEPVQSCLPPEGWGLYEVQGGDTLDSLAELTKTSVDTILQANCLYSSVISPGQQLYLPFIPPIPPGSPITPTLTSTPALTAVPPSTSEVTRAVPDTPQANAQLSMYDPHTQAWVTLCSRNDFYAQKVSGALILPTPFEEGGNALLAVTNDHIPPLNQTVDKMGKTTLSVPGSNFSFDVLAGTVEVGTYFEVTHLSNAPDSDLFKLLPTPVDVKACLADYTTTKKIRQITRFAKPIGITFDFDANTLARAGGKDNLTIVGLGNGQWADLEEFGASVVRGNNTIAVDSGNLGTFSLAVR